MQGIPKANQIIKISDRVVSIWHEEESGISSLEDALSIIARSKDEDIPGHVEILSIINTTLWHEEDKARDSEADDSTIADVKRKIDRLNGARVDKVEEIDSILFSRISFNENATMNTETPGSVIDRLSIFCLKRYHMDFEAGRSDSSEEHRNKCNEKLALINQQISDLSDAYDNLLEEIKEGKRRYSMYRQFKMYNDPELNPVIYGKK